MSENETGELAAISIRRSHPRKGRGVLGNAVVISAATFLSRILGLGRDVMMASLFGFSREMDVFFLAFTLPNLFRKLFGEGALASAVVPVLTEYRLSRNPEGARRLIGTLTSLLILGLGGITAITILTVWVAPASWFGGVEKFELFRSDLTILLPYVVFICIAALQSGALNVYDRYGVPATMPAVANGIWIAVLVGLMIFPTGSTQQAIEIMSLGVLFSGVAQWVLQMPSLRRAGLLTPPRLSFREPGVKRVLKAMAPMLFALAVFQINTFMDQILAEVLVEGHGAVSSYSYASRLFQFPLGLVAVALGTAMLPLMSRFAAKGEREKLTASILNGLRLLMFIALPAAAGLAALAYPITSLLFGGDNSSEEMLRRSALVTTLMALNLPLVGALSLITKAFYAMKDTKTPTRMAVVAVAVNLVANVILLQTPLLEAGLALGTAISAFVNLAVLVWILRRRLRGTILESMRARALPMVSERLAQPMSPSNVRGIPLAILRSALVAVVMAVAAYFVEQWLFGAGFATGRVARAISVTGGTLTGVVVYFGLSFALGANEAKQLIRLKRKR